MKHLWRQHLKKQRLTISKIRRLEASQALVSVILPKLTNYSQILSFASLPDEINTHPLNEILARQGKLLLPRIENSCLQIYHVQDTTKLVPGPFGILEPNPSLCLQATPSIVLVPALGFDIQGARLGYGKGFYDKLLACFPSLPKMGVGFLEQQVSWLPTDELDIPMTRIWCV